VLAQLLNLYPEDVRIVYRHFPLLSIHDKAALSMQAAEAAGLQGKFWEMHDLLYATQQEWSALSLEEFQAWSETKAGELGLDLERFKTDLVSPELAALAQEAWNRGQEIGLPGTPFLTINGQPYRSSTDLATLELITQAVLLSKRSYTECPPMVIDPSKSYTAIIETEKGNIVLELLDDVAPLAVNSFVFLARDGWFDGVTFHRVLPGFVAQTGDPSGTGIGNPGYQFQNEVDPNLVFDRAGLVGMANSGADTNGSQFFITYGPVEQLNGGYTIFARVVEGMDVAEQLTPRDPAQKGVVLPPGDEIIKVTINEQ
jgi:cyclophilin family peptidyl-prolyl cis-trans isomerase